MIDTIVTEIDVLGGLVYFDDHGIFFQVMFSKMEALAFTGESDGVSDIIEIDESIFGKKRKNNRGTPHTREWIFGIVQRKSRKTYFVPVTGRSKDDLLPIISNKIKPGATIFHDDWAAYRELQELGYKHDVVVHTKEFVSKSGACTNTIEGRKRSWIIRIIRLSIMLNL